MKYILNNTHFAKETGDGKYLVGSSLEHQFEIELDEPSSRLLCCFREPRTRDEVLKEMKNELTETEIHEIIDWGLEATILRKDFEPLTRHKDYNPIYDRQIRLFEELSPERGLEIQKKLSESKVVLLGVGGVGSYVLFTLAAMGSGFVRAVDFDEVEVSNLSRQILYTRQDVGKSKIECAKERISTLNPDLKYEYINKKFTSASDIEQLIHGCDFCILAADTPRKIIVDITNTACLKAGVPYINGASTLDSIVVGPMVIPGKTRDYSHISDAVPGEEDRLTRSFTHSFTSSLIDPYNSMAASFVALECVKYLTNFSEPVLINNIMITNLRSYETTMVSI